MTPRISVIVPLHNSANYLAQSLGSLLEQTFDDFEAICIDDASVDDTLKRAQRIAAHDNRFRVIALAKNTGPAAARNAGLDLATGDYLAFLDADDYLVPHALEILYTTATEYDLDLADFYGVPIYESDEARETRYESIDLRTPIDGILSGPELFIRYQELNEYHCALYFHFVRRSLIEEKPHLRLKAGIIHEDELFSPLLHARAKRCMFIHEALYKRTIRMGSLITRQRGIFNVESLFTVTQELDAWVHENAHTYNADFIDAFAWRIWELREIMAADILRCSETELSTLMARLNDTQRVDFSLYGVQHATALLNQQNSATILQQKLDDMRQSHTWHLGDTLAKLPRWAAQLARK